MPTLAVSPERSQIKVAPDDKWAGLFTAEKGFWTLMLRVIKRNIHMGPPYSYISYNPLSLNNANCGLNQKNDKNNVFGYSKVKPKPGEKASGRIKLCVLFEVCRLKSNKYIILLAIWKCLNNYYCRYDVPEIAKYLDFINVMTYDFHGQWERQVGHNSPLYPLESATSYQKKLTVVSISLQVAWLCYTVFQRW